jgi:hypothetical protein
VVAGALSAEAIQPAAMAIQQKPPTTRPPTAADPKGLRAKLWILCMARGCEATLNRG